MLFLMTRFSAPTEVMTYLRPSHILSGLYSTYEEVMLLEVYRYLRTLKVCDSRSITYEPEKIPRTCMASCKGGAAGMCM